jgi:hypothetical protein
LIADAPTLAAENAQLRASRDELLKAAKRALNVLKAQGESLQPGNVLSALDAAITAAASPGKPD